MKTAWQIKHYGTSTFVPRVKSENEALPITFVQSQINEIPKMEPTRPGASDHLKIKRIGVNC